MCRVIQTISRLRVLRWWWLIKRVFIKAVFCWLLYSSADGWMFGISGELYCKWIYSSTNIDLLFLIFYTNICPLNQLDTIHE